MVLKKGLEDSFPPGHLGDQWTSLQTSASHGECDVHRPSPGGLLMSTLKPILCHSDFQLIYVILITVPPQFGSFWKATDDVPIPGSNQVEIPLANAESG
jgi:hypothetical protein